jgi:hypothetical protein
MARRKSASRPRSAYGPKTIRVVVPNAPRKKKKKSRNRKRKGKGMSGGGAALAKVKKAICSISDPFCPAAYGAKYPDSNSANTLSWTNESWYNLTTDANGNGAIAFSADPGFGSSQAATIAIGGTVTTWNTSQVYPNWTNFASVGVAFRVVSHGVHVRPTTSANTSQGSIGIIVFPANTGTTSTGTVDLNSMMYSYNERASCTDFQGLTAVARAEGTASHEFRSTFAPGSIQFSPAGFDVPIVYAIGAVASSSVAQIRLVTHYELMFSNTSVFNSIATKPATENPSIVAGNNFVQKMLMPVLRGGQDAVMMHTENLAERFARGILQLGGAAIGGMLGGPTGVGIGYSGAGMLMDAIEEAN